MAAKTQPSKLILNDIDVRKVNEVVMVSSLGPIPVLLSEMVMKLLPHCLLCLLLRLNNFGWLLLSRVHNEVVSLRDSILPGLFLLGSM